LANNINDINNIRQKPSQ